MILLLGLFWILLGIALFGLARLLLARRGTAEDWQALVAFAKGLPLELRGTSGQGVQRAELLAGSPPGLLGPGREAAEGNTLSARAVQELIHAHRRMLQSEMKFFAHRIADPSQWFLAGLRGLVSLPLGLAIDFDAAHRARRRALDAKPDFRRVVNATLGVVLFAFALAIWIGGPEAVRWLHRFLTS